MVAVDTTVEVLLTVLVVEEDLRILIPQLQEPCPLEVIQVMGI